MTLVEDIKKEIVQINKNLSKRHAVFRAREHVGCANLALELGLKKKADSHLNKANSEYRTCLMGARDEEQFSSYEQERENANIFVKEVREGMEYADPLKRKQDGDSIGFLRELSEVIDPNLYRSIRTQKQYAQIFFEPVIYYPNEISGEIDNLLERLVLHKTQTEQLPDLDFQYISGGVDNTYDHIFESCSTGPYNRDLECDVFEKRFNRMRDVVETGPNKKLVAKWFDEKLKSYNLREASFILELTGVKGTDPVLTKSFKTYLRDVERTDEMEMISITDIRNELKSNPNYECDYGYSIGRYHIPGVRMKDWDWYGHQCTSKTYFKALEDLMNYQDGTEISSDFSSTGRQIGDCYVELEQFTNGFGVKITGNSDKREETINKLNYEIWPKEKV